MEFILNPLLTQNIKENILILSSYFKELYNINLNFFLFINGQLYYLNSSIIQNIRNSLQNIDQFDQNILNSIISNYLKNYNIKTEFIKYFSFVENSFIIIAYDNKLKEKDINFIENCLTNILMKNLYEFKLNNLYDDYKSLKQKYRKFSNIIETIYNISENINKNPDKSKIIEQILQFLLQLTNSDCCSLSVPLDNKFIFCFISDKSHENLKNLNLDFNKGLIGKCYNEKSLIIENNPSDSIYWDKETASKIDYIPDAILANPIFNETKDIIAILEIFKKDDIFNDDDIKIIKIVSPYLSILLNN
jgi:hypothetical protein